jgi:hypothetical protein
MDIWENGYIVFMKGNAEYACNDDQKIGLEHEKCKIAKVLMD